MAKKRLPSISIVTATYDGSYGVLDECLRLVREQNYPQDKIEIVLGHGGSKKKIDGIAKKYNARVIIIPPDKQNAEYNRGVAFNKAKNDLVLILDNDNFLPYKNWMRDMVEPFLTHLDLVATESCFYHYDKSYSLSDRYFALFGTSEPLPYYLGKADRMPWGTKEWILRGDAKDCGNYYLVKFEADIQKIPTVGTNGCLMRRKLVTDNADVSPEHHYPIDVMVDVIKSGHNKFAFVKNSIIHKSGYTGFLTFLKRRYKFADEYHFRDYPKRRYSVYTKADFWPVVKYVFYSLTIIGPTLDALKGFMRIPDIAWFLQPFMAFGTTVIYGAMTVKNILSGFNSKNSNNLETKSLSKKTNKSVLIFSICYLPNIGGVETHLKDLENELVKRDWNVTVLTYQPLNTPTLGKWVEKRKNVVIYRLPIIRGIFYELVDKPFLEFFFLFPLQFIILPLILLMHPSIQTVNAQGIVSGFSASIWAKIFGKKYVIAAQSIYDFPTSGSYHLM
ncbi:glycosyltransferase, partial [Patescibacteria group bacterium]|nr:glycosyltransferase [Patescibacteria group bacterium]